MSLVKIMEEMRMPIETEIIEPTPQTTNNIPVVIPWKDAKMIRNHSIRATVKEILQVSKSLDVVKIGIIGNQGTGKSTLSQTLAHLIHKMSDVPFSIRIFDKKSLLDFENTLKSLSPANYVLIFDDVSFLGANATKKQIETIKQALTIIRHLDGGQDVKIICILNYHYTLGLDKYMRMSDFRYFTSVGSSELDNMQKIVGNKYMNKILEFQRIYTKALVKEKFTFRLGPKGSFTYSFRKPFAPILFFNNDTLRYVVSPTRQWIDKICSVCSLYSSQEKFKSQVPIAQFITESGEKLGEKHFKHAVKFRLLTNGINVLDSHLAQALRYLDRALEKKEINLEEIATHYDFKVTNTKLRKNLDGVLA